MSQARQNQPVEHTPTLALAEVVKVQERTAISVRAVHEAIREEGIAELGRPTAALAWSGLAAGLSMVVWLLPASEGGAKVAVIVILTYIVGLSGFSHIVAGSVEALYLVATGSLTAAAYLGRYLVPTLLGNTIGGVTLVAVLHHAQVVAGDEGIPG